MATVELPHYDLSIAGSPVSSAGGRFDVIDPATENKVASVANGTVEDAKAAVDAASAAFPAWAAKKPRERGFSNWLPVRPQRLSPPSARWSPSKLNMSNRSLSAGILAGT